MALNKNNIISGRRLILRRLKLSDVGKKYLGWMNDAETQKYTRRRGQKITLADLKKFILDSRKSPDCHFAIVIKDGNKHIGNIFLNIMDNLNKSADVSIMVGDREEWGKGYAKEAIELISEFAFKKLKLHLLSAGSPNPAFNALIKKLGWKLEGKRREAFLFEGKFIDMVLWSILENEWKKINN